MTEPKPWVRWTEDQIGLLTKLHSEGLTATLIGREINREYGTSFTRNAIIGAAHRANLPKRVSTKFAEMAPTRRARDHGSGVLRKIDRREFRGSVSLPKQKISAAPFLGISLMGLEEGQCRYPRGEKPTLFCGQPQQEDSAYCPHCHAIAHVRLADAG